MNTKICPRCKKNEKAKNSPYCLECKCEYVKNWNKNNPDKAKKIRLRTHRKLRLDVLKAYSNGDPKCACCGEKEIKFLSVDHINGGGIKHREELGGFGLAIYRFLRKNNYPDGYQILCMNCNFAKGHYDNCPHQDEH